MSSWIARARALLVATVVVFGAASASGQKPPAASSAKSAASAPAAAPSAAASAVVPPGHPPVGDGLPAGHPNVADQDEQGGDARAAAEDSVVDDPALPAGTLVVTIKDGEDKPVANAPVTLGVLHSTVAKGDTNEQFARQTDDAGSVRFDGLAHGSGYSFRVSTARGAASYALSPFNLGDKGKRAVLHSFDASGALDSSMMVVMRAAVAVSLREDAIVVQQLISVINLGRVAWLADMPVELPRGFKAFNKQDAMEDARIEELPGTGAAIRGTFPPGERELEFTYQVPLDEDASQTIHLRLPARVTQTRVIAEASRTMGLDVRGFPPAKRVEGRDGKRILLTDFAARAPGEASAIDITLTGLPTHGPGRWLAVMLAVAALAAGGAYFAQTADEAVDADARRDLADAREALLTEIVALERAHKSGEIGPKTYARVRASLLDALARIVAKIEAAAPKAGAAPKKPKSEPSRPAPTRKPPPRVEDSA